MTFDANHNYLLCLKEIELVVIIMELEYNMNIKKKLFSFDLNVLLSYFRAVKKPF